MLEGRKSYECFLLNAKENISIKQRLFTNRSALPHFAVYLPLIKVGKWFTNPQKIVKIVLSFEQL